MPSLVEGQGGRAPLTAACAPHFSLHKILFLKRHATTKATDSDGKGNNYVQIQFSFEVFSILCEIAGNQLLYINLTQYSVLLTRLYGESLPVLLDYQRWSRRHKARG